MDEEEFVFLGDWFVELALLPVGAIGPACLMVPDELSWWAALELVEAGWPCCCCCCWRSKPEPSSWVETVAKGLGWRAWPAAGSSTAAAASAKGLDRDESRRIACSASCSSASAAVSGCEIPAAGCSTPVGVAGCAPRTRLEMGPPGEVGVPTTPTPMPGDPTLMELEAERASVLSFWMMVGEELAKMTVSSLFLAIIERPNGL